MRAEEELQMMADFYPEVCPTRKRALQHLFCTVGNGYKWENGELVEINPEDRLTQYTFKEPVVKAVFPHDDDWIDPVLIWRKEVFPDEDKDEEEKPFRSIRFGRASDKKYFKMFNYPDDIKPDWKALIEECKQYIIKEGLEQKLNEIANGDI